MAAWSRQDLSSLDGGLDAVALMTERARSGFKRSEERKSQVEFRLLTSLVVTIIRSSVRALVSMRVLSRARPHTDKPTFTHGVEEDETLSTINYKDARALHLTVDGAFRALAQHVSY